MDIMREGDFGTLAPGRKGAHASPRQVIECGPHVRTQTALRNGSSSSGARKQSKLLLASRDHFL